MSVKGRTRGHGETWVFCHAVLLLRLRAWSCRGLVDSWHLFLHFVIRSFKLLSGVMLCFHVFSSALFSRHSGKTLLWTAVTSFQKLPAIIYSCDKRLA